MPQVYLCIDTGMLKFSAVNLKNTKSTWNLLQKYTEFQFSQTLIQIDGVTQHDGEYNTPPECKHLLQGEWIFQDKIETARSPDPRKPPSESDPNAQALNHLMESVAMENNTRKPIIKLIWILLIRKPNHELIRVSRRENHQKLICITDESKIIWKPIIRKLVLSLNLKIENSKNRYKLIWWNHKLNILKIPKIIASQSK